jgi:MFS transporter, SP family, solute carrier family 2 (myo-inositol transporter), member 13
LQKCRRHWCYFCDARFHRVITLQPRAELPGQVHHYLCDTTVRPHNVSHSVYFADKSGRRRVILYADALFLAGAVLQAVSSTVPLVVAGRCIVGAGVGAGSFVVPLYIAEIAPASHRGKLVTTNILFITGGQVVAYVVGWLFATYGSEGSGWRWMVGLGAIPAGVQAAVVVFMPETPRWLVKVGKVAAARRVLQQTNGGGANSGAYADSVIKQIEMEARQEQENRSLRNQHGSQASKLLGAWQELISEGKHRRALAIACLLQALQQLCGFVSNNLLFSSLDFC